MADDVTGGGDTGAAVEGQAGATDGGSTGAPTQGSGTVSTGAAPQEWRIGDQKFTDPTEMHKAALNWQKQFTQVSQQRAEIERNYRASQMIVKTIARDPLLQAEVIRRMQGGQSQQQAVQQTANAHPELAQLRQQVQQYGSTSNSFSRRKPIVSRIPHRWSSRRSIPTFRRRSGRRWRNGSARRPNGSSLPTCRLIRSSRWPTTRSSCPDESPWRISRASSKRSRRSRRVGDRPCLAQALRPRMPVLRAPRSRKED